jgi:DNA-binding MarR family transcriptional regulator
MQSGGQRGSFSVDEITGLLRQMQEVTSEFEKRLGEQLTVNPTDLVAMEHLIQDGPLTPTDLARRVGVTTAAMTTSIDRLTAVGHVTRLPNPADRRGVLVVPAEASVRRAMGMLMPMIMGIDRVLADFDDEKREVIASYLRQVVEVYRSHLPGDAEPAR